MNEEELKLLNKLDDLPNKLNLEIRGLILAEVMLRKENQELKKQQKEFIKWLENESKEVIRDAGYHQRICLEILDKYKEIIGSDNK